MNGRLIDITIPVIIITLFLTLYVIIEFLLTYSKLDKKENNIMAKRVAKFEKISKDRFVQDWQKEYMGSEEWARVVYDRIKLPQRATKFSAGYDFYSPLDFMLQPGNTIKIPTGIRCGMNTDWVLMIYPRSSLGFKYQLGICNTIPVIDADYYFSDNEGHIFVKLVNRGDKPVHIKKGDAFAQGIFMEYGIVEDDHVETTRNGGIGSTDQKE